MTDAAALVESIKADIDRLVHELVKTQATPARAVVDNQRKLTPREVKLLREMHRNGTSQAKIAIIFDINPGTVSRIVRGQYHK
jgi:DNA-binding NarL/FixJ family response regulator